MQDIAWFVGITAAVVSVANILSKGNRLVIGGALFVVFGAIRSHPGIDHLTLSHLGFVSQGVVIVALIGWSSWFLQSDECRRYLQGGSRQQQHHTQTGVRVEPFYYFVEREAAVEAHRNDQQGRREKREVDQLRPGSGFQFVAPEGHDAADSEIEHRHEQHQTEREVIPVRDRHGRHISTHNLDN